jgi:hypothetical protein
VKLTLSEYEAVREAGQVRLRLTDAQVAALEGRGLEEPQDPAEDALAAAWRGQFLMFAPGSADLLFEALRDASNAEDAFAEMPGDRDLRAFARRAARSLAALSGRVLRASR